MGARRHPRRVVIGAAPVGHHEALEAPLIPEDLLEQMRILVSIHAVDPVVGGHDGLGATLLHRDLKPGEIDLPQRPLVHDGIGGHAAQLLGVGGEVLGAGGHAIFLDAPDIAGRHLARQIRIFGEILEVPPAEGGALDVQPRPQQDAYALGCGFNS